MFESRSNKIKKPKLSIVIVCYNMQREIIRTIQSLLPPFQLGITRDDLELIVVDNGSHKDIDFGSLINEITFLKYPNPNKSPAAAVNFGIKKAAADLIGVFIDGARMASPGLCKNAIKANRVSNRSVISTLAFHLGPLVQMDSVFLGYNQDLEDKLLNDIDWLNNGYDLFNISSLAGSSIRGLFQPIAESNGLFMSRELWDELGGLDEDFKQPGGGLVNLDTYKRACELPNSELIMLISEATFHQVHGGIATNQKKGIHWSDFSEEYYSLRQKRFISSNRLPTFFGNFRPEVIELIQTSIDFANQNQNKSSIQKMFNTFFDSNSIDLKF